MNTSRIPCARAGGLQDDGASSLAAVRVAYDTVAVDYAASTRDELASKPLDRAMLATFAELVIAARAGPVADLGCGPGWVTAHLTSLGVSTFGIDLSPHMVDVARRAHPGLRFVVGSMTALDLPDAALGGIVAWYSIIHTPPHLLAELFVEFHRVLSTGGQLLLAFQVGDERRHVNYGYGHTVSLDAYRLLPGQVAGLLTRAGLALHVGLVRQPGKGESAAQGYLLAHRP